MGVPAAFLLKGERSELSAKGGGDAVFGVKIAPKAE